MINFRRIDPEADRDFLLDLRVLTLFQNETPWARSPGLPSYRRWYLSSSEPERFLRLLARSLRDPRTIGDIIEVDGTPAGFIWATFVHVRDADFRYMELLAMGLRPEFQRQGLGRFTHAHVEAVALQLGADAVRSFTGAQNEAAVAFHKSQGFAPIEIRYEKLLKPRGEEDDDV